MIKELIENKFIESKLVKNYNVLTPKGWIDIQNIGKTIEYDEWLIITSSNKKLICADTHILYRCDNIDFVNKNTNLTEMYCKDLHLGDLIMTNDGPEMIMEHHITNKKSNMYDLQLSEGSDSQYYTNGILSHNSLWMQNFACKSADMGNNVLYITLEMSERKVMKRLGAMRLKIPINDYDVVSKDTDLIKKKIASLGKMKTGGDMFDNKVGKIYTKFWPAGTATINDFERYIEKLQQRKDLKINLIIVDYITLIAPNKSGGDTLYIQKVNI
jgi:replicative DNA helicase